MTVKIDQALASRFITASFGLPIVHENAAYTPIPGTAYAEINVLTNDILASTVNGWTDTTGVFQFILRYPEGKGAIAAKTQADTIFAAFAIGARETYSGQTLTITGHSRPTAVPEDGWFKVVGQVTYKADIAP